MKWKHYYYLLFLMTMHVAGYAQNDIRGRVVDMQDRPVESVAVVLQTTDSVYIDAVVTDSLGIFRFNRQVAYPACLLFQHVLYEPAQKEITSDEIGIIRLKEKSYALDGIEVKAERPQVKVENGALKYDVPQLMAGKSVSNAFEVVKQIPGIISTDETIQLLGAGSPAIILNGQLTTMSVEQLINLLKTMPASRVQHVEVMYNAPAKYNVKGALINVILDKGATEDNVLQGEAELDYMQKHYAGGKARANLLYSVSGLNVDFLIDGYKGREFMGEEILARHTLKEQVTEINQSGIGASKQTIGTVRLGMDYTFKNKDKLSAAYFLNPGKSDNNRTAITEFQRLKTNGSSIDKRFSSTVSDDKNTLHNVRFQYDGHTGIMAGGDFTCYHSPSSQVFKEYAENNLLTDMQNNTKQDISRLALFLNHSRTFKTGWSLNYGIHGSLASSKTYIEYLYDKGNGYEPDIEAQRNNRQTEYSGNVFAEVSKGFGEHFSATVSLKTEYFKSDYETNGKSSTLWNDWALFPNASLSYVFSPKHILQLTVNSEKNYPSYWAVTPQVTPLNSYSEVMGNPELKPFRSYDGQLLYIFNQKYTFLTFFNYSPDYFAQLPYQSTSELKNIFRYENIDYQLQFGLGFVVPFRIGSFMNSQFTAVGIRAQEKASHFHDLSFDNKKYTGQFTLNNTFTISKSRPNLKLDLNGYYVTGGVQGLYDLGSLYNVSTALKWQFADDKVILMLKCNNIFRSNYPHSIVIDQAGQYSNLYKIDDTRCFMVSFIYKFGGYKKKQHESVDASRFGKS